MHLENQPTVLDPVEVTQGLLTDYSLAWHTQLVSEDSLMVWSEEENPHIGIRIQNC